MQIKENEENAPSWALQTLSDTMDSSQYNSGNTSDDGRPSYNTILDEGRREQLMHSTTRLPAAVDEPYHVFGKHMKWAVVIQIGVAGTFSGLSSNIYFPCLKTITKVNHLNSIPSA